MSILRSRGLAAGVAFGLAVALHPRLAALSVHAAGRAAIVTLALLVVAAVVARAMRGATGDRLLAVGATLVLAAVGWDGLRGYQGTLALAPGQVVQNVTELGPDGRPLGLRPLGFQVGLEALEGRTTTLAVAGRQVAVTPARAAAVEGVRIGQPKLELTGAADSLQVTLADASGEHRLTIPATQVVRYGELELALEQYFADFALDARNEPFSRSNEPRNPAALLRVRKGGQAFRVFVLASAPGIHKVEGLGASFTLTAVDPERMAELRVSHAPAAPWALLGLLFAGAGLALQARKAPAPRDAAAPGLAAGALLSACLLTLGSGNVLRWSWTSGVDGVALSSAGAGLTLGVALLATLGGTLLVAVPVLASGAAAPVRPLAIGRRVQLLGATVAVLGAIVVAAEAGLGFEAGYEAALLIIAAAALALALTSRDARSLPRGAAAAFVAMLAVVGAGSWLRWGGYDTAAVEAVASLAFVALAVSE